MKTSAVAVFVVLAMSSAAAVPVGSSPSVVNDVTDGPWGSYTPSLATDGNGVVTDMPQDNNAQTGYPFMQADPDSFYSDIRTIFRKLLTFWSNNDFVNNTEANNGTNYHHSMVKMINGHRFEINDSLSTNDKGTLKVRVVNVGPVNEEDVLPKDDQVKETDTNPAISDSAQAAPGDAAINGYDASYNRPFEPQVADGDALAGAAGAAAAAAATFSAIDDERTDDTDVANLNAAFVADNAIEDGNGTPETNKADDGNARLPMMDARGAVNRRSIVGQTMQRPLLAIVDNGYVDDVQEADGNSNESNDAAENFAMIDYDGKDNAVARYGRNIGWRYRTPWIKDCIVDVVNSILVVVRSFIDGIHNKRNNCDNDNNNNNNNHNIHCDEHNDIGRKDPTTTTEHPNLHGLENDTRVNELAKKQGLTTNSYAENINIDNVKQSKPQSHITTKRDMEECCSEDGQQSHPQSHIPTDQSQSQAHIPTDQWPSQSHIPTDQSQSQAHIPIDQWPSQSHIPTDQSQSQSHIPTDQWQSQSHIPIDQVEEDGGIEHVKQSQTERDLPTTQLVDVKQSQTERDLPTTQLVDVPEWRS